MIKKRVLEMTENYFAAWFVGEASNIEKASSIVERYKGCPYIYFMSQKDQLIYGIFLLGTNQKWWIEYVEQHPGTETLDFENISITYLNDVSYPDSFHVKPLTQSLEIAPCGVKCSSCPQIIKCSCCPATVYYKS